MWFWNENTPCLIGCEAVGFLSKGFHDGPLKSRDKDMKSTGGTSVWLLGESDCDLICLIYTIQMTGQPCFPVIPFFLFCLPFFIFFLFVYFKLHSFTFFFVKIIKIVFANYIQLHSVISIVEINITLLSPTFLVCNKVVASENHKIEAFSDISRLHLI